MKALREAIYVSILARSPIVFFVFIVNLTARKIGSKYRIRKFSKKKIKIHEIFYFVDSWDGLLVLLPGHEPLVRNILNDELCKGTFGLFVNVGAHIGRYCLELAEYFDKTIAYEPTENTFSLLKEGWKFNPSKEKLFIFKKALSNTTGNLSLFVSDDESKNSIIPDRSKFNQTCEQICMSTLDDELSESDKVRLRILLIDVEGAEEGVLLGAEQTLKLASPLIIIELLDEKAQLQAGTFLRNLGYEGERIDETNWFYRKNSLSSID